MANEFAHITIANEIDKSVRTIVQEGYADVIKERGIAKANLGYRPFKFGEPGNDTPPPYRTFFYNERGQVVKKFSYTESGVIETKEESIFEKWDIIETRISTLDYTTVETYEYVLLKGKNKRKKYTFFNPKWSRPKVDEYQHDNLGRIISKTSYGLLGEPELITHYIYDGPADTKVTYRHVTLPDETTVLTLMYEYDSKKEKQTGLYRFDKMKPDDITGLRKSRRNDWKFASVYRYVWEYDKNGNNNLVYRDDMYSQESELVYNPEETTEQQTTRILTEKTSKEYALINKKYYLVKEIEWLTRFNEPLKAVKEFTYYDKNGVQMNNGKNE